jgi:hypothetical protein
MAEHPSAAVAPAPRACVVFAPATQAVAVFTASGAV